MSEGVSLRSLMIERTCAQNCMGHEGNSGGCCTLGDRDFIMGPVLDADAVLERLSALWGRAVPRAEVFIDFEEGRALFPELENWQNPKNFPALRVRPDKPRIPCVFFDEARPGCSIYEARPHMCEIFACDWLKAVLELF